jgi:hypothetical protein
MRWFRANAKFGGRLALFALALQFVLSFGHIHIEDLYGPGHAAAAITAPGTDGSQPQPANHPSKHSDDYCAVCATMSLLGNSFIAAAPLLPQPLASQAVERVDHISTLVIAPLRSPFQSRAPPEA